MMNPATIAGSWQVLENLGNNTKIFQRFFLQSDKQNPVHRILLKYLLIFFYDLQMYISWNWEYFDIKIYYNLRMRYE